MAKTYRAGLDEDDRRNRRHKRTDRDTRSLYPAEGKPVGMAKVACLGRHKTTVLAHCYHRRDTHLDEIEGRSATRGQAENTLAGIQEETWQNSISETRSSISVTPIGKKKFRHDFSLGISINMFEDEL